MRMVSLLIFFTLFLSVYGGINFYIYRRGRQAFCTKKITLLIYRILFLTIALSFLVANILKRMFYNSFVEVIAVIGSFYFVYMLYILIAIILLDISRLANKLFSIYPMIIKENYRKSARYYAIGTLLLISLVVGYGYHHACSPIVKHYQLRIKNKTFQPTRIAFVSDIHMGIILKNSRLEKMVRLINSAKPDLVILGGDIIDEDIRSVIHYDMGTVLEKITAPLGLYGITGNHEYIGGVETARNYLIKHGVTMLSDNSVIFKNRLRLVGREDYRKMRMTGKKRKELKTIINEKSLSKNEQSLPLIIADHQPFGINDAITNKADLLLCGHTHNGQIWPIKYIVSQIFAVRHGLKQIEQTFVFVSSGYGTWGPPVRIATDSEIIIMDLIADN